MAFITLLAVSLIIFVMSRAAGDPRHIYLDDYSTQEDWDKLTENLGLDKPYFQQYGMFLVDAFSGKFGDSISEGPFLTSTRLTRIPGFRIPLISRSLAAFK